MADYFSDGHSHPPSRAKHGDRYFDPATMNVKIYDETLDMWFKVTKEEQMDKLPVPPPAVSGVYIPGLTTKLWPGDGDDHKPLPPPPPPREKPITDYDFDEEDFEL